MNPLPFAVSVVGSAVGRGPAMSSSPVGRLVALVEPYANLVLALFFFGFFAAAFVAIAFRDRPYVRKGFVACFFAGVIVTNLFLPSLPPLVSWSHFAQPVPETVEYHEIRVVDENGNELSMDNRATLSFDGVSMGELADSMLNRWDAKRRETVARRLVLDARAYREEVTNPSPTRHVEYPHHGLTGAWTPEILAGYGEFVGIRIYSMTFETSPNGTEVRDYEEERVLEIYPFGEPDGETPPNTVPPVSINRTTPDAEKAYEEPFADQYPFDTLPDNRSSPNGSSAPSESEPTGTESGTSVPDAAAATRANRAEAARG